MGYEDAAVWDNHHHHLIRYGGHNQGGGGEQNAEVWTYDPATATWTLREPNTSPPGVCCAQQNLFDPVHARYLRFPAFSGSHGWQWWREIYLNNSSVWSYDPAANRWRNLRPLPAPRLAPLRCASYDTDHNLAVLFGGEGSHEGTLLYDPSLNIWTWPKPPKQPPFRSGGNMAYDASCQLHILFGAQFTNDPHTWAYDLAKNEWRDLQPPVMPPTDKNDAVLAYDSLHRVILAVIRAADGSLQTWAFNTAANRWTKMNPNMEPDPSGNRARCFVFAPELNLAILENRTQHEQQIWTYRFANAPPATSSPRPRLPRFAEDGVVSVISTRRVELTWKGAAPRWHVERAAVEVFTEDQLRRLKSRTPPLAEPSVGAFKRIGPFTRLATVGEPSYTDTSVDLTKPASAEGAPSYEDSLHADHLDPSGRPYRYAVYAYRVVTDDGAVSPAWFTIPSAPQFVFSREAGETCELKWVANPEKGIQGYRVYRMDGRFDKEPISRLTPDPLATTSFADPTAGKKTRRYYVVAVDAIGQEGFPSAPVWYEREWKRFYDGFAGEWHQ